MDKAVEAIGELMRKLIPFEAEKRNKEMPEGKSPDETVIDAEVKEAT